MPPLQQQDLDAHLENFGAVVETYMKRLVELGLPEEDTKFEVIEFKRETRIRFSSKIFPIDLMEEVIDANKIEKYKVTFEVIGEGKVDLIIHEHPLIPAGSGFVTFLMYQTILARDGRRKPKKRG